MGATLARRERDQVDHMECQLEPPRGDARPSLLEDHLPRQRGIPDCAPTELAEYAGSGKPIAGFAATPYRDEIP